MSSPVWSVSIGAFIFVLMARSTIENQQRQPWGMPPMEDLPQDPLLPPLGEANTVDLTAAQLDRIRAALTHLEAQLALTDLRVGEHRGPPQPDPDPPDNTMTCGPPGVPLQNSVTGNVTTPFGQPTLTCPGSYNQPHNFHAAYHAPQREVQQPHNYLTGPDPYAQPAYQARQPTSWDPPWLRDQPPPPFVDGPAPQQNPYAGYPGLHHQPHNGRAEQPRQTTCWDPPWSSQTTPYQPEQQDRAWDYAYGPPSYQHVVPSWQRHNPCLGTPPWQPDHTVLYPSIPPPLPQRPLSWDPPSFQPLETALLPAAVAAPPRAYDSRQPSRLHLPCSMNECSIEIPFEDNVTDLEKESESERRMPEESHNFDDKSINDGAFDADDKLIPQRTDTPDRSLDSTLRSSLMGSSLEQLQSEQGDKIKERSCPEQPVVVRQPLLRFTNLCCSALTTMASAAAPRPPQPHPPFYARPRFVTDKDRLWEEVPRNVAVAIGTNVASINHRSTSLDTDGRLIPPRNDMSCTIMYCHKFLLTKYDEEAEVVDALGEWSCPKYIGIWNCIVCIKKKGDQYLGCEKVVGVIVAHSFRRWRSVNSFNGKADSNLPDDTDEKSKKAKNAFFSTVDVLTLHRLCASLEHLHTFDPGGEVSPKLMFAMLFMVSWFPP